MLHWVLVMSSAPAGTAALHQLAQAQSFHSLSLSEHAGSLLVPSFNEQLLIQRWLQAFRDNERISVQDEALAQQLWSCTGLREIFADVDIDGWKAVGLNPNIRVYK